LARCRSFGFGLLRREVCLEEAVANEKQEDAEKRGWRKKERGGGREDL
jgi:hypothetical protein